MSKLIEKLTSLSTNEVNADLIDYFMCSLSDVKLKMMYKNEARTIRVLKTESDYQDPDSKAYKFIALSEARMEAMRLCFLRRGINYADLS